MQNKTMFPSSVSNTILFIKITHNWQYLHLFTIFRKHPIWSSLSFQN